MRRVKLLVVVALSLLGSCVSAAATGPDGPTVYKQSQADFLAGRFDLLEAAADAYRTKQSVSPSGNRLLASFYDGLTATFTLYGAADANAIERHEAQVRAWLAAYPNSRAANIMTAIVEIERGWLIRGPSMASGVSAPQWRGFHTQLARASAKLSEIRDLASDDPQWHATVLRLALEGGVNDRAFDAIAKDALDRDPGYGPSHSEILRQKLPEWGGDWRAYDRAIDDFAARTAASTGQAVYAQSYWDLSKTRFKANIFEKSLATWPRMKQGFEDMVARYPSDANLNAFGSYACLASDFETLRPLLERFAGQMRKELWVVTQMDSCVYAANRERIEAEAAAYYAKPRPVPAERAERWALRIAAADDFVAGRFEALDRTHAEYLSQKTRTASGEWNLGFFYEGLQINAVVYPEGGRVDQPDVAALERQVRRWLAAAPGSKPAAIALGRALQLKARVLTQRGFDVPKGEADAGRALGHLQAARKQIDAIRDAASDDPEYWAVAIAVARDDRASEDEQNALAGEALAREPTYTPALSEILQRGLAGKPQDYDPLVRTIIGKAPPELAPELYARSFAWLAQVRRSETILENTRADWPVIREGLDRLVARHPTDWNLNGYAILACLAKDKLAARLIFAKLDGRVIDDGWRDWRTPTDCQAWADQ